MLGAVKATLPGGAVPRWGRLWRQYSITAPAPEDYFEGHVGPPNLTLLKVRAPCAFQRGACEAPALAPLQPGPASTGVAPYGRRHPGMRA
jgi:hypothetical protein